MPGPDWQPTHDGPPEQGWLYTGSATRLTWEGRFLPCRICRILNRLRLRRIGDRHFIRRHPPPKLVYIGDNEA